MTKMNIPGLHGGISQQDPLLRLPNTLELADNVVCSLTKGLSFPRYPTKLLNVLPEVALDDRYELIETTDGKTWLLRFNKGTNELTLTDQSTGGMTYVLTPGAHPAMTYLDLPNRDLEADLSIKQMLDYTFLLNKAKVVAELEGNPPVPNFGETPIGLLVINQVVASTTFSVSYEVTNGSGNFIDACTGGQYVTPTGGTSADIFSALTTPGEGCAHLELYQDPSDLGLIQVRVRSGTVSYSGKTYICTNSHSNSSTPPDSSSDWSLVSSTILSQSVPWNSSVPYYTVADLVSVSGVSIEITTSDSYGNQMLQGHSSHYVGDVDHRLRHVMAAVGIEGLPPRLSGRYATVCFEIAPHYYMRWDVSKSSYVETTLVGTEAYLDPTTMPVALVYDPSSSSAPFDIVYMTDDYETQGRLAGDTVSVPSPRFVDKTISDLLFFRNRMCYLSDDAIVLSKSGDFFNFYGTTATEVLDDDPIDVTPTSTHYNPLISTVAFAGKLNLFSPNAQFLFHSGYESLTPKTATADLGTGYSLSKTIAPQLSGASLFLPVRRGEYLELFEYALSADSQATVANSVSAHVPTLIPSSVDHMITLDALGLVLLYTKGQPKVYVYRYKWNGDQLVQSAWVTWDMGHPIQTIMKTTTASSSLFFQLAKGDTVTTFSQMIVDFDQESAGDFLYALDDKLVTNLVNGSLLFPGGLNLYDNTCPTVVERATNRPITGVNLVNNSESGDQWGIEVPELIEELVADVYGVDWGSATVDSTTITGMCVDAGGTTYVCTSDSEIYRSVDLETWVLCTLVGSMTSVGFLDIKATDNYVVATTKYDIYRAPTGSSTFTRSTGLSATQTYERYQRLGGIPGTDDMILGRDGSSGKLHVIHVDTEVRGSYINSAVDLGLNGWFADILVYDTDKLVVLRGGSNKVAIDVGNTALSPIPTNVLNTTTSCNTYGSLTVHPDTGDIYCSHGNTNEDTILRVSRGGGNTWDTIGTVSNSSNFSALDYLGNDTFVLGTTNGIYRSVDDCQTWELRLDLTGVTGDDAPRQAAQLPDGTAIMAGAMGDVHSAPMTAGTTGESIPVVLGAPIFSHVELSEVVLRDEKGLPRNDLAVTVEGLQLDYIGGYFTVTSNVQNSGQLITKVQTGTFNSTPIGTIAPERSGSLPQRLRAVVWGDAPKVSVVITNDAHMITHISNITYNLEVAPDDY